MEVDDHLRDEIMRETDFILAEMREIRNKRAKHQEYMNAAKELVDELQRAGGDFNKQADIIVKNIAKYSEWSDEVRKGGLKHLDICITDFAGRGVSKAKRSGPPTAAAWGMETGGEELWSFWP